MLTYSNISREFEIPLDEGKLFDKAKSTVVMNKYIQGFNKLVKMNPNLKAPFTEVISNINNLKLLYSNKEFSKENTKEFMEQCLNIIKAAIKSIDREIETIVNKICKILKIKNPETTKEKIFAALKLIIIKETLMGFAASIILSFICGGNILAKKILEKLFIPINYSSSRLIAAKNGFEKEYLAITIICGIKDVGKIINPQLVLLKNHPELKEGITKFIKGVVNNHLLDTFSDIVETIMYKLYIKNKDSESVITENITYVLMVLMKFIGSLIGTYLKEKR